MTHLYFTLKTSEIQNLIDQCMCQVFLGRVITSIFPALYFCTLSGYRAVACWLGSFVTF